VLYLSASEAGFPVIGTLSGVRTFTFALDNLVLNTTTVLQMRDIQNGVHHEDADDSSTLTDNEILRFEEEQYQQLQKENDFLRSQLAEASCSIIYLYIETLFTSKPVAEND